jgi:hypothetical protein
MRKCVVFLAVFLIGIQVLVGALDEVYVEVWLDIEDELYGCAIAARDGALSNDQIQRLTIKTRNDTIEGTYKKGGPLGIGFADYTDNRGTGRDGIIGGFINTMIARHGTANIVTDVGNAVGLSWSGNSDSWYSSTTIIFSVFRNYFSIGISYNYHDDSLKNPRRR